MRATVRERPICVTVWCSRVRADRVTEVSAHAGAFQYLCLSSPMIWLPNNSTSRPRCNLGRNLNGVTWPRCINSSPTSLKTNSIGRRGSSSPFRACVDAEEEWQALADRAEAQHLTFYQLATPPVSRDTNRAPHVFPEDPSGNLLEFKYYVHESAILESATTRRSENPHSAGVARDE